MVDNAVRSAWRTRDNQPAVRLCVELDARWRSVSSGQGRYGRSPPPRRGVLGIGGGLAASRVRC